MIKLEKFVIGVVLCLSAASVSAQSNDIIDVVLKEQELTCGNGAYLVLTAAGMIDEGVTPAEALAELKELGWIGSGRETDDSMSLGEYSAVIMRSFSMPGGIMYSITKSPRYASRELGYLGYISSDPGAYRTLKGNEALSILGLIVRKLGG